MWGQDSGRRELRRPCNAERSVPNAWRQEHWASDAARLGKCSASELEAWSLFSSSNCAAERGGGNYSADPSDYQIAIAEMLLVLAIVGKDL